MSYVKKQKKFQIAYKENRMSSPLLDRRQRYQQVLPHLTCNVYSQALLLGRLLVPLVDHHLPAMNINNIQLIMDIFSLCHGPGRHRRRRSPPSPCHILML